MFVSSFFGSRYWFPDKDNRAINSSTYYTNLQAPGDVTMSVQSVTDVLFPANISRLLPPSFVPVRRKGPPKPPPTVTKRPPPAVTPKSPPPATGTIDGLSLYSDCTVTGQCLHCHLQQQPVHCGRGVTAQSHVAAMKCNTQVVSKSATDIAAGLPLSFCCHYTRTRVAM